MDAKYHTADLKRFIFPATDRLFGDKFTLQLHNAFTHTAQKTKGFLKAYKIDVIDRPAKSLDVNTVKNN